jgi:uncharacterized sulfatase
MGIDLLPTFCKLAGLDLPKGVELDGRDISAVLTRRAASPHDELLLFNGQDVVGVRTQKWKYITADYFGDMLLLLDMRGYPALYDMRILGEQYSVASVHVDVVEAMRARLAAAETRFRPFRTSKDDPLARQRANHPVWHLPEIWQD